MLQHNASPGADLVVLIDEAQLADVGGGAARGRPPLQVALATAKWGLVPRKTPRDAAPDHWRMFNARSETAREKSSFCDSVRSRRCVCLLDGFFEWKKRAKQEGISKVAKADDSNQPAKQPWIVRPAREEGDQGGELLYIAGVWDEWTPAVAQDGVSAPRHIRTFTILTTEPCKNLAWLHDRQPVILDSAEQAAEWLRDGAKEVTYRRLVKGRAEGIRWHKVRVVPEDWMSGMDVWNVQRHWLYRR